METERRQWWPGRLLELDEAECWDLLSAAEIGRIAWCERGGPVVLPVNIAVRDGEVWLRTKPQSSLASHVHDHQVAVEVDDVDPFNQAGWSVLVRGRGEMVAYDLRPPGWEEPTPWAEGSRPLLVRVVPTSVTGRRLLGS